MNLVIKVRKVERLSAILEREKTRIRLFLGTTCPDKWMTVIPHGRNSYAEVQMLLSLLCQPNEQRNMMSQLQ